MNDFNNVELNSVHDVKVLICYLLDKLNRPVTEEQLYEIALNSEVINYFYYTEAMGDLLKNQSVIKVQRGGETYIEPTEKGRFGADYFNESIPYYFRKQLLKAAMYYFARLKRESEADIEITETPNGCEVNCKIKDTRFDLMRISLYAPDYDQAKLIKDKILLNPADFYSKVVGFVLENEEESIQINVD
ncbi:MAG: DUF4364 family protein [Oscillospiraceae bacterium]